MLFIVFGSISLSELALRQNSAGGVSAYYAEYIHPALAAAIGFFQTFIYLPAIIAIVSWVANIYTWMLIGKEASLEQQLFTTIAYTILLVMINIYTRNIGGHLQNLSSIIKLIPLLLVAVIGIFWTKDFPAIPPEVTVVPVRDVGWSWLSALVPLAFSYEGWVIVVNLAPEIKNPEKNLVRALILGPIIILLTYLLFFYGMNQILGPSFIMSTGDGAVQYAINMIFGEKIGKLLLVIVIISVLGVANGMFIAGIRMPQALASKKWIHSPKIAKLNPKYQLSTASAYSFLAAVIFWLGVHYLFTKYHVLANSDISEVPVVFNNICLVALYIIVIKLYKKGEIKNVFTGLISPILAILATATLFIGSFLTAPVYVTIAMLCCVFFCYVGYYLYKKSNAQPQSND